MYGSRKYPYTVPTPRMVIRNSKGEGILKPKLFKERYETKLEFPDLEGWGHSNQNTILGGSMDIFWNNTMN